MSRRTVVSAIVLVAALVLAVVSMVRSRSGGEPPPGVDPSAAAVVAPGDGSETATEGSDEAEDAEASGPLGHLQIVIYFPARAADGLVGEAHEIFMTAAPGDRAKQIIADLISGPTGEEALRALPPGTQVRQVFVLADGTAYVDFSADLRQGIGGGSTEELLAVYAIVNSVALNIPEIRRLGILIDGRPIETLNGHIDLRRPLPPDRSLIVSVGEMVVHNAAGTEAISR